MPERVRGSLLSVLAVIVAALVCPSVLRAEQPEAQVRSPDQTSLGRNIEHHEAWIVVDKLNTGLSPPDRLVNRETPRAALETFHSAAIDEQYLRAAHVLDLSLFGPSAQQAQGPVLARRLFEVMERMVWIDWAGLPDRADGLDEVAPKSDPMAGIPRKSIRIALLDIDGRLVSIRLERVKAGTAPPVWVFSPQTVENVPALYEAYGPTGFERMLPHWLRSELIWELQAWELLLVPAILLLALGGAWIVYRLASVLGRSFGDVWAGTAVRKSRAPLALLASLTILYIFAVALFAFSGPINKIVLPLLLGGLIGGAAWLGVRIIDTVLDIVTTRYVGEIDDEENSESRHIYTNISVARRVILLVAVLAAVGLLLNQLHAFESLGISLLASAGIISIIFGFAAQTVLGNIISSVQIALAKPIRIGDTVNYEGHWGYIEEINYTFVLIRVWDYRRLVVPVKYFVSQPFENWSIRDAHLIEPIELRLDHRTDVQSFRERFESMLEQDEDWDERHEPKTLVVGHDEDGITVRFYASASDASRAWELQCRMREALLAYARESDADLVLPRTRVSIVNSNLQTRDRTDADPGGVRPSES